MLQPAPRPRYALALAAYVLVGLALLAPVLPAFAAAIPGGPIAAVDGWQNVWNLWWVQRALSAGQNPYVTDLLYYPNGAPLYLQTLGLTNGVLALPITALWGPTAAYNALILASVALTGLAGYGLGLLACGHRGAAFGAGLLLALAPFTLTKIYDGQLELAALHWPAFAALFLARALAGGRRRDALLAGLLLAATGLSSWYYLLFLGPPLAALTLLWPAAGRADRRRHIALAGIAGLSAGLLLLPVALPALATATGQLGAVRAVDPAEVRARSLNLLDPLLPSYLHPLWGEWAAQTGRRWHSFSGDWNASLGYGTLALTALGAWRSWRAARAWLAAAGVALIFALGPELLVGPWATGLPLPYSLLAALPGLSVGRRPLLFVAMVAIMLTPPAALGLRAVLAFGARRPWAPPLIAVLLVVELLPRPWPLQQAAVHPYFQSLRGGAGPVMEIPPGRYKDVEPQRSQMAHGRPIVGGYLARTPVYPWAEESPGVRALWRMRPEPGPLLLPGGGGSPLDALRFYGVRDIVVRWDLVRPVERPDVEAALAETLPGLAPVYDDGTLRAYHVPDGPPRPFAALSSRGWYEEERREGRSWRWMADQGAVLIVNPLDRPILAALTLRAEGYEGDRQVDLDLDGTPLGTWRVRRGLTATTLRLWLPPGEHRVSLRAATAPERGSGRPLSIVLAGAELTTRPGAGAP